jgi:hypothetical protein
MTGVLEKKPTQCERVLKVLQDAEGKWVSNRHFKQVMLISEVNGRISELRGQGHIIETSEHRDDYGFSFHRLNPKDTLF